MSTDTPSSVEPLLVEGNVNVGKDKGTGILLLTSHSVFALRTHMGAAATGAAAGGLIGALIGAWIDKKKANKRDPSEHMEDPEILALPEKMLKKVKPCSLLIKAAIDETLLIKRTRLGYQFTLYGEDKPLIVFQGLPHKKKIAKHIEQLSLSEQA